MEFIWETHGIHAGTGKDHVKHGIDQLESVAEEAIRRHYPGITFIIHSPRLTRVRYQSERNTDIKFIRGDRAFFEYPQRIRQLKEQYQNKIEIRFGIELEWMGGDLGLPWNRSKIFQCHKADFVIGSVHFSREGLPYDGTAEEAQELLRLRGSVENYWLGYLEEMIEMIDQYRELIHVVGHLDLPKLHIPMPAEMIDLDRSGHILARRLRILLEMISESKLALDVNLAGIRKGCGLYPHPQILKRAEQLGIPFTIGTDAHSLEDLGAHYTQGIEAIQNAGYAYYISFSRGIAEKRPLQENPEIQHPFHLLNLAVGILGQRTTKTEGLVMPRFAFGGSFRCLLPIFPTAVSLGEFHAIRVRRQDQKLITISDQTPPPTSEPGRYLFSHHQDLPGTMAILFNTLASEEINVQTAYLQSLHDGTATAYLTVNAGDEEIQNAIEFIKGTAGERFIELSIQIRDTIPPFYHQGNYLLEIDGVDLPIPISPQMIITIHNNRPGTLLILLSALASQHINIHDLQLGERGSKGYAVLGVNGPENTIKILLSQLGNQFFEASLIEVGA